MVPFRDVEKIGGGSKKKIRLRGRDERERQTIGVEF